MLIVQVNCQSLPQSFVYHHGFSEKLLLHITWIGPDPQGSLSDDMGEFWVVSLIA